MHREPVSTPTFPYRCQHFVTGDAVDFGVHEAVDYVLRNGFDAGRRWAKLGDDSAAYCDGEAFSLIDFADELGESSLGFEEPNLGGHDGLRWHSSWIPNRIN
jgi:hypothetical protein